MNNLTYLIRQRISAIFGRHFRVLALFLAATVIALFAFTFLLMAVQSWLARWFQSPIEADLTVAGVLACVAFAVGIMGERVRRSPRLEIPIPIALSVAAPVAMKITPKLVNTRVLGIACAILGAVLIRREFVGK